MYPSICGVCVEDAAWTRPLKGLKVNARCFVPSTGHSREEDVLFTEYGLSGLAVLFLSNDLMDAYAKMQTSKSFSSQQRQRVALHVDFLPSMREEDLLFYAQNQMKRYPDRRLEDLFSGILPQALVHQLLLDVSKTKPLPRDKKTSVEKFVAACKNKVFYTQGARSEETGQVTCGGAQCAEFDAHTMQHQSKEHLYALGEVLNVQGICGGYNLHWAWASAHALADHFSL